MQPMRINAWYHIDEKRMENYMNNLNYETRFYHREGFQEEWPRINIELPAILLQHDETQTPEVIMGAQQLNEQKSLAQLRQLWAAFSLNISSIDNN